MTLLVARDPLRRIVRSTQGILFVAAIAMLVFCGFNMAESWIFQQKEARQFEEIRDAPVTPEATAPPPMDGLVGRIQIERLGISVMVMEGADDAILRHAAGHIPGTALPGEQGNIGISAHRDTFFRPLRNIRMHDRIRLATPAGDYRYRVVSVRIVKPTEVSVLDPGSDEVLTLITCYPFYFVGAAPKRFIVRAERVRT